MASPPQEPNDNDDQSSSTAWSFSSLFSSSPSSLKERFHEFDDQQRITRLSACRELDRILHDCQKRYNNSGKTKKKKTKSPNPTNDDPIESISIGLRNMKYFGWRGILQQQQSQDEPDLTVFHPAIRSSCAREQHAVWACRAVATGCGKDLAELKRCFEYVDNSNSATAEKSSSSSSSSSLPPHIRVLTTPYTNYDGVVDKIKNGDTLKEKIPCYDIQKRLGSCVTASGKELLERKQQRDQQQQRHQR